MQRIVRNDKTKRLDQSGVAMVEAAIAIPCFLMLFLTTLQVTILVTAYISASEAAAVAARETAAAGGGTVVPFNCAAYARSQMQREMDRLVVPARATAVSFVAATSSTGIAGFKLQATINISCPLCVATFGLGQSMSNLNIEHFVSAENTGACI